jgi:hypothetical protein
MLGATLAVIAGVLVGLYVRWVLRDKGYGVVADVLLCPALHTLSPDVVHHVQANTFLDKES